MFKRVLSVALLGLSLIGPLRTNANAQVCEPTLLAFYGICIDIMSAFSGSVEFESILKKLQNANITKPSYEITILGIKGLIQWVNKAGNAEPANGQPFNTETVSLTSINSSLKISKNGTARDVTIFEDDEIIAALEAAGVDVGRPGGQGGRWTGKILVTEMQAFGTVFECATTGGDQSDPRDVVAPFGNPCNVNDAVGQQCFAPAGAVIGDKFEYVGSNGSPPCDTLCSDGEANTCPQPPQFIAP